MENLECTFGSSKPLQPNSVFGSKSVHKETERISWLAARGRQRRDRDITVIAKIA